MRLEVKMMGALGLKAGRKPFMGFWGADHILFGLGIVYSLCESLLNCIHRGTMLWAYINYQNTEEMEKKRNDNWYATDSS